MRKKIFRRTFLTLITLFILFLAWIHLFYKPRQVPSAIFKETITYRGHRHFVFAAQFSPDGATVASAGVDSTIQLWDRATGKTIKVMRQPAGITYMDWSRDGQWIVTSAYDSTIRLWNVASGTLAREFKGHTGVTWTCALSPDATMIASASEDNTVRVWESASGKALHMLKGHTKNIWSVKFSPDGKQLASAGYDLTVKTWDLPDLRQGLRPAKPAMLTHTMTDHTEAVVALAYSHDGRLLASTSDDFKIHLWDPRTGKLVKTLSEGREHVQGVAFSPDDKWLIVSGRDKPQLGEALQNFIGDSYYNPGVSMRLWDIGSGKLLQTFSAHANDVNDVQFSRDGKYIVSAGEDKIVKVWEKQ
jgi:WD40 repeat protein